MIEHLIVWACLATSCKTYHPIANMYMFDTMEELQPYCASLGTGGMNGIVGSCTRWASPRWEDTTIYYSPEAEHYTSLNDPCYSADLSKCHRSALSHELYRAKYHYSGLMIPIGMDCSTPHFTLVNGVWKDDNTVKCLKK